MQLWTQPLDSPRRTLFVSFVVWKATLLIVAAISPGPGYDTSTSLVFLDHGTRDDAGLPWFLHCIVNKLTRWDAIYFAKVANRGYLFEQEWAFGWGFSRLIAVCTFCLHKAGVPSHEGLEGLVGICIAHTAHLLSTFVLFSLTRAVFPGHKANRFALITGVLHIISPAGLFLSAPYAESSCALLTFSGYLLFVKSFNSDGDTTASHDLLVLISGVLFGIATTFRSNGLLNGLAFLQEALQRLVELKSGRRSSTARRLLATGLGGMSIAAGFLLPQYIAYMEYCAQPASSLLRPWCQRSLPSIYTFVQEHYWNVGFLRYWTLSNLPLFVLASPMIAIMIASAVWALKGEPTTHCTSLEEHAEVDKHSTKKSGELLELKHLLRNMAVSQLLLTLITVTNAHVQIITRISSAYPVSLWYVGSLAASSRKIQFFVRFMIIYAIVQGGLFSSFLPPA